MATFYIRFSATCETKFGQRVAICGNLPELGSWEISRGLMLQTDEKKYPVWSTESPITISQGLQLQFKLCILDGALKLVRWQEIKGNRQLIPKSSLHIEFSDSDIKMTLKKVMEVSTTSFDVNNPQHANNAVINGWGSDTSSNQDMLEHQENDDEDSNSLLLSQFAAELKKAVATQRQEHHLTLQPQPEMQQHNQLQFGDCSHHHYNTHYFHTDIPLEKDNVRQLYSKNEKIIILCDEELDSFKLSRKDEVSVFHLLGKDSKLLVNKLRRIRNRWRDLSVNLQRGNTVVYLEESIEENDLKEMLYEQVDAFICNSYQQVSSLIERFSDMKYIVKNRSKDEFVVDLGTAKQLKIIYYPFDAAEYIQNFEETIDFVKKKIMSGFYFSFNPNEFETQLKETLTFVKLKKDYSLIVLNLNKLDDLLPKTINQIVHLPSLCSKIIIFVITREKFPKNIQHRISVSRNKMIFINAHGQVYANNDEIINICHYIEISQLKFDENIDIVLENLGNGITESKKSSWNQVQIEFSNDLLGRLLKERALKCIRDVNKKSIAKIIAEDHGNKLMLMPFCLHHSFLTQVIMKIYTNRLKSFEKGLVISIDGTDLKSLKSLKVSTERQLNIKFMKFYLHEEDQSSCYTCNPIKEHEMQKMIQIIANEIEEGGKPEPYRRNEVLSDIKNLR